MAVYSPRGWKKTSDQILSLWLTRPFSIHRSVFKRVFDDNLEARKSFTKLFHGFKDQGNF